jgi:hypothetical protein
LERKKTGRKTSLKNSFVNRNRINLLQYDTAPEDTFKAVLEQVKDPATLKHQATHAAMVTIDEKEAKNLSLGEDDERSERSVSDVESSF